MSTRRQVLSNAARELPAAQRPEIIAVSVDIYADTPYDLHEDFSRWNLVPSGSGPWEANASSQQSGRVTVPK